MPTISYSYIAIVSKPPKNCALRLRSFTGSQALYMYLESSRPKLNHDNIIETLMVYSINSCNALTI